MLTTLRRAATRTGSALALLAVAAGIPAGLLRYVGSPLPSPASASATIRDVFADPVTTIGQLFNIHVSDQVLIGGMAGVVWVLWLLLIVCIVVEIAAAARGVTAPRLRMLGPMQGVAAALVAGLTAGVLAPAAIAPLSPALGGQPAAAHTVTVTVAADASTLRLGEIARVTALSSAPAPAQTHVTLVIAGCGYEHQVVKDESLWRIAQLCLGDANRWPEIWELNKDKHWPQVSGRTTFHHPDLIFPGWVLQLPADAVPPPAATPTTPTGPAATPGTPPPAVATPAPPASAPATASPSASVSTSVSPSTEASTSPAASPASSASTTPQAGVGNPTQTAGPAAHPSASDPAAPEAHRDAGDGIAVPGGWITAGLGGALLLAVAMVWKRRRHRYTPTPITTTILDDPDLAPPLAARTLIRQTLRRNSPQTLDEPDAGPTVREYAAADVKPELPPAGQSAAELAGAGDLPVTAGLGLDGPGALDAARGLLVATLGSGHAGDPDAQGSAVIPASTLATLLGVSAVDLGPMGRLHVTATFADAMTYIEEEIIRRSRVIADAQTPDVAALRAQVTFAQPLPQLLLIADAPPRAFQARLATAIGLGASVDIGAALIGAWPPGVTLTVDTQGHTTGGDGQRLAVLDADAAAEAITMLREAHGELVPPAPALPQPREAIRPTVAALPAEQPSGKRGEDTVAHPRAETLEAPAGVVRVRVLGEPAVIDRAGLPAPKLRGKSRELLVYLALYRAGAPLNQIMEAIWPDVTMGRAAQRLSTCVANLRGVIRAVAGDDHHETDETDETGDTDAKLEPVVNSGGHYRLDPGIVAVDWWSVLDEYAQVATAGDDNHRLKHLQAAIAESGGALAQGADYEWIESHREYVRRHQIKLYAQAAGLLADSDPHQARIMRDAACDIDPLSDELARQAMRAAAALGDADAIRYRLDTLRREGDDADIELDPDTEQLAAELLRQLTRHPRDDN